jgi:hypothetical protein
LVALAIAAAIYGIGVSVGAVLWATDALPRGATHNDCENFAKIIAKEKGISKEDVEQSDIKALAEECLAGHVREESAVLHDFVTWSVWPAVICAMIFLIWPAWARTLDNQDAAEGTHHGGA